MVFCVRGQCSNVLKLMKQLFGVNHGDAELKIMLLRKYSHTQEIVFYVRDQCCDVVKFMKQQIEVTTQFTHITNSVSL